MIARSAQTFVLTDASKFGTTATYRVAPLTATRVITDWRLDSQWRARLADMGVEAAIAEAGASDA
jgi:DeoR family fructose operon transcriptional repressor